MAVGGEHGSSGDRWLCHVQLATAVLSPLSPYTIYIVPYPVFHHSSLTTMQITAISHTLNSMTENYLRFTVQQTNGRYNM